MFPFCGTHPGISLFIYHTTVSSQIRKWRRAAGTKATRVFRVLWKIHPPLAAISNRTSTSHTLTQSESCVDGFNGGFNGGR